MGNFCVPKKIDFTKINSNASMKTSKSNDPFHSPKHSIEYRSLNNNNNETKSTIKEAIMESGIITSELRKRLSGLSNESILISRQGSIDNDILDCNSTDSEPETFINTSLSSRSSSPIFGASNYSDSIKKTQDRQEKLKNRFMEICFTKHNHTEPQIESIDKILTFATRNTFAEIIDFRYHNNTILSVAIIENNYSLLRCLMRYIPDFPEYVYMDNQSIPLVQAAALTEEIENENMLSIILKMWAEELSYLSIVIRNITAKNSNNQGLFEFLVSQIKNGDNRYHNIHFRNLELFFQLIKVLQSQNIISNIEHKQISLLCSLISVNERFWTPDRRKHLVNNVSSISDTDDNIGLILSIYHKTN